MSAKQINISFISLAVITEKVFMNLWISLLKKLFAILTKNFSRCWKLFLKSKKSFSKNLSVILYKTFPNLSKKFCLTFNPIYDIIVLVKERKWTQWNDSRSVRDGLSVQNVIPSNLHSNHQQRKLRQDTLKICGVRGVRKSRSLFKSNIIKKGTCSQWKM